MKVETLNKILEKKIDNLVNWFIVPSRKQHLQDQEYLKMDTKERSLVKYGYLLALKDVQALSKED